MQTIFIRINFSKESEHNVRSSTLDILTRIKDYETKIIRSRASDMAVGFK